MTKTVDDLQKEIVSRVYDDIGVRSTHGFKLFINVPLLKKYLDKYGLKDILLVNISLTHEEVVKDFYIADKTS